MSDAKSALSAARANQARLITCIVPKGKAWNALRAVQDTFEVTTANIHYARGVGRMTPLRARGVGEQEEKEVLTFTVDNDVADAVFEFAFEAAQVDRPHGGIIFMAPLSAATQYLLPDVPVEE